MKTIERFLIFACILGASLTGCVSFNTPASSLSRSVAYSTNSITLTQGIFYTGDAPVVSGNNLSSALNFSVSPALPSGLGLDPMTGAILGVPTVLSPPTLYTISASYSGQTTTSEINLEVIAVVPTALDYTINPATYYTNTAITPNTPHNNGGTLTSYSVTPALPAGLSLHPTTGVISGTPTTLTVTATYVVTGTNTGGSVNVNLVLTVYDAPPSSLTYSTNPAIYLINTMIATNTPTVLGGTPASFNVSPALPAGLSFNTATGVITGTPTASTPANNYTVTATNSGGSAAIGLTITVNDIPPSALIYSTNPANYSRNGTIVANVPSNSGGVPTAYSIFPPLPPGLTLNMTTGVITGTPTGITNTTTYTVLAGNTAGTIGTSLVITVNEIPPTTLVYSSNPAIYTKTVAITNNTPSNSAGVITNYSISPALPAGLSFNATTGVISGTPTAITATATYTVTGTNVAGSTTASVVITVNDKVPTVFTYSTNPATYVVGSAITTNTPSTSGGGPVVSYSVSPALPGGLTLNTTTGVITGTPTTPTGSAVYVVSATNTGGSVTVNLTITVNNAPPNTLTYSTSPATYNKNIAITNNTPSNGGGTITSYSILPALSAGLSFNTTTGVISGTPTILSPLTTYTITGTNALGSTNVNININVLDTPPTNLTYSANPVTYVKGTSITNNTPSYLNGAPTSYSISPALSAGLSFNTTTGVISGTPTAVVAATTRTVTATNAGGSTTASVAITVNDMPPTSLTYSTSPATYYTNTAMTSNNPSNSGGTIVSYSISPALPTGMSMSTSTGVITGTPTVVSGATAYTITGVNSGGSTSVSVTINTIPRPALTAFVVGSGSPTPANPDNFGNINVDTTHTFTVRNAGDLITSALTISLAAGGASKWAISSDTCTGNTLAAGATCTVNATFLGSTVGLPAGSYSDTLRANATTGGLATNTLQASAAYTWQANIGYETSQTINSTSAPSGACPSRNAIYKTQYQSLPAGTSIEIFYNSIGDSFCSGGKHYYQMSGQVKECGGSTVYTITSSGSACQPNTDTTNIYVNFYSGLEPYINTTCDTSYKYIVTTYTCK